MAKRERETRRSSAQSVLRAAADELGVTTPKSAQRPRRKGPLRVRILNGRRKYYRG